MENYVTWDQLIQVGILVTAVIGLVIYIIYRDHKKEIAALLTNRTAIQ